MAKRREVELTCAIVVARLVVVVRSLVVGNHPAAVVAAADRFGEESGFEVSEPIRHV